MISKKNIARVIAILMIASFVLAACQPAATPAPTEEAPQAPATEAPKPTAAPTETPVPPTPTTEP